MNQPTKEICRQACIPSSKVASVLHPEPPRETSRSWHMLATGACLFFATSCDTNNEVNREGIRAHDVERARQEFHVDGSGVKVCVLSDSTRYLGETRGITRHDVKIIQDPIGVSQAGIQKGDDGHGGKDKKDKGEGTAMLEIVHSIAPGAELMFATSGHGAEEMAYNIKAFGKIKCKIIVDDEEYWGQSPFEDDKIAQAVNEVTGHGVLYITSAGNQGNTKAAMSGAWEGYFKAGRVRPDGTTEHMFAPGEEHGAHNEILGECGRRGGEVNVHLHWNGQSQTRGCCYQRADMSDYGLRAMTEKKGKLVPLTKKKGKDEEEDIKDTAAHTHGEKPYRHISFPAPNRTGSNRTWIVITKAAGAPDRFLHLDFSADHNGCSLQYATGGAITGHHGAESVLSVASKSASERDSLLGPNGALLGGPDEHVNFDSSEGPRKMFFAPDGHRYDPPRDLKKPDVTAADGVTTGVPDFKPFWGTSAAAPQVAGIAALMWSKHPSLTAEDIKDALRKSAIQIEGAEEWSPLSGYGIVNAVRALCAAEKMESREASSPVCTEDYRRSHKADEPFEMSMAKQRSEPLK